MRKIVLVLLCAACDQGVKPKPSAPPAAAAPVPAAELGPFTEKAWTVMAPVLTPANR